MFCGPGFGFGFFFCLLGAFPFQALFLFTLFCQLSLRDIQRGAQFLILWIGFQRGAQALERIIAASLG